jgi:hypothetical protein
MDFQRLCADLIAAEGGKNVRGFGTGTDQGNDFMFDLPVTSPMDTELLPYIAQCKWYKPSNSVGEDEVGDVLGYLDTHQAVGLLIITSSQFTGTAVTKMEAISRSTRHPYKIKYWDGIELSRRIRKYPEIINRYWSSKEDSYGGNEQPFVYDEAALLEEYGLSSQELELRLETFPVVAGNEDIVEKLVAYAIVFDDSPPRVTILEGGIGAGKTGFALSLLNRKRLAGFRVAIITWYEYNDIYCDYALRGDNSFVAFSKFCREVDLLLFDDFGMYLTDKSETLIQAANVLIDIVQHRATHGKPTILAVARTHIGKTIGNYVEYLRTSTPSINLGSIDLRGRDTTKKDAPSQPEYEVKDHGPTLTHVLGRAWLVEKYHLIESEIDRALHALLMPDETNYALRKYLIDRYGDNETREDEIREMLHLAKQRISEYRRFVSSLGFEAMLFYENGSIEIERPK